jgi:hypothetical protein
MKIQYRKKSLKIPKGQSEATKGAIRSHQRGNQKPPKGQAETAKGASRSAKKKMDSNNLQNPIQKIKD